MGPEKFFLFIQDSWRENFEKFAEFPLATFSDREVKLLMNLLFKSPVKS